MSKAKFGWRERACALVLLYAAAAIASPAQTFKTLVNFDGTNGASPLYESLVQGTDGNLYGTTSAGANGFGTVFKITPTGTLTTMHSFDSTDGENPPAGLFLATNGSLYGTTTQGGANGDGTVFKITASGTLTTLYSFCAQTNCSDGLYPLAALVQTTNGNFYGTTYSGGTDNEGTIFKITPSGTLTTLYSFCAQTNCTDGANPFAALVQATDGNFYGTTQAGGSTLSSAGTIFKITPSGTLTTLYTFCPQGNSCTDGESPQAALIQASDGNLYGITQYGGANPSSGGTIFKITPSGMLTTLYSFCPQVGCADGYYPNAGLVQATDGNFYGTTLQGGAYACSPGTGSAGTIFKITPSGTLTTLYNFCPQGGSYTDGANPDGGLVEATNGALFGTATGGGFNGNGTVFGMAVSLHAFVETVPAVGKVGQRALILGTNLTGATSVTFNGTAATFAVVSHSLITTTVPAGATTGKVQVTTPHGTLLSNVPFRVLP